MLGQPQPYLINLKNLKPEDLNLVGREAIESSFLHTQNIPTPTAFVITSRAFDDFLTATQLVEPLMALITETNLDNYQEKALQIQKLIIETKFPTIIERPIIEGYKNMNASNLPFVTLEISNIIKSEYLPQSTHHHLALNIYGGDTLLQEIKKGWAELFKPEAIKLRLENGYEGILTTSIIVQKMIRPELSGRVYSLKDDFSKNIYISAIYGLEDLTGELSQLKDIYKVEIEDLNITERNIVQQSQMLVRKGKTKEGDEPNMKVNISSEWQGAQKLEDERIIKLAELTLKINEYLNKKIELSWGIETGEISIFSLHDLNLNNKSISKKESKEKYIEPVIEEEIIKTIEPIMIENKVEPTKIIEKLEIKALEDFKINEHDVIVQEPIKQLEKRLLTKIFVDAGNMQSEAISETSRWKYAYISGTDLILNAQTLPEHLKERQNIINFIQSLSLQVNTIASIIDGNELIYSLSSIDNQTLQLLGINNSAVEHLYDERLINSEEALLTEVSIVKKNRNENKHKNISLVLSSVSSYDNLMKLKRIISGEGLRRSASFKIYAEVSIPFFALDLERIDNDDIDGLVIDISKFARNSLMKDNLSDKDYTLILNEIKKIKEIIRSKNVNLIFKLDSKPTQTLMRELLLLQPHGIIVNFKIEETEVDLIEKVEREFFEKMLVPLKKRGRKIKNLF